MADESHAERDAVGRRCSREKVWLLGPVAVPALARALAGCRVHWIFEQLRAHVLRFTSIPQHLTPSPGPFAERAFLGHIISVRCHMMSGL